MALPVVRPLDGDLAVDQVASSKSHICTYVKPAIPPCLAKSKSRSRRAMSIFPRNPNHDNKDPGLSKPVMSKYDVFSSLAARLNNPGRLTCCKYRPGCMGSCPRRVLRGAFAILDCDSVSHNVLWVISSWNLKLGTSQKMSHCAGRMFRIRLAPVSSCNGRSPHVKIAYGFAKSCGLQVANSKPAVGYILRDLIFPRP